MYGKILSYLRASAFAVAAAVTTLAVTGTVSAQEPATVTINESVDMSGAITSLVGLMGGVIVAVLAGYFGFLLVKIGVKWINSYFTRS